MVNFKSYYSGVGLLRDIYFSHPLWLTKVDFISRFYILKINMVAELVYLIFSAYFNSSNLRRPPLLGFEVRDDVIFSQSGHECPVILCPVIPHPTVWCSQSCESLAEWPALWLATENYDVMRASKSSRAFWECRILVYSIYVRWVIA